MGAVLQIALVMSLVFLVASMLVMAVQEIISSILRTRALALEAGLKKFLGDPDNQAASLLGQLKAQPLIATLQASSGTLGMTKFPTYVAAQNFSSAVVSAATAGAAAINPATASGVQVLTAVQDWAAAHKAAIPFAQGVYDLVTQAEGDLAKFKTSLEGWFDGAMDRVTGVYKRWAQVFSFLVGLAVAALLNIDAIGIYHALLADPRLLASMSASTTTIASGAEAPSLKDAFAVVAPLIGGHASVGGLTVVGWLITALASALGAPFWFDLMKQIVNIRGAGPKPDAKT